MKILCISQRFYPVVGGSEQLAETYMSFLSKNHDVTVYTSDADELNSFWNENGKKVEYIEKQNYKIKRYPILIPSKVPENLYNFPFSTSVPGPFCPQMWEDLLNLKEKFDLIIATSFPYDHIVPAFVASKKYNIPLVIIPHLHLEFPELYFTGLRLTLLSESTTIVVNTNSEKQALVNYGIQTNKIHVIPPGIAIKSKVMTGGNFRKQFHINDDSTVILFAGTKSHAKGVFILVESLKTILDKCTNFELVLIGPSSKEFEKYLAKQSEIVLKHIHDLGVVSEETKQNAFSSCDIFALPSKSESFGISFLEAWLCRKPVIGCKIDAVSDLIDDGKNGILVEFGNVSQLVQSIENLIDKSFRNKLGEQGFTKLTEMYDSDKLCREFESLCLSVHSRL